MNLERLPELIGLLADDSRGVTIRPIHKGMRIGGFGSDHHYEIDGWEVGYIDGNTGGEIAVGPTIADAIDAALEVLAGG